MQINKEPQDKHSIQSYGSHEIKVNGEVYAENILISKGKIITGWHTGLISELNEKNIQPIMKLEPEIFILGHEHKNMMPGFELMQYLSQNQVGFEFMSIGAACRTFNVLLSEKRKVVLGIIFP